MKGLSNTGGSGSSGHVIVTGTSAALEDREYLQFGGPYNQLFTEDDPTNNKTIVHGQIWECDSESDWYNLSDEEFKSKYGAYRIQDGVIWYRPWANSLAYQTDLTPVGTVLSCAVDTTNTTIFPADLIEFPNKDYVICRGATVKISDYPLLYQYFEDEYGDGNYFGTAQTAEGYFVLPNWSADFPTNGVLVIKARVTSDVITFAEVDQTGESARTDEVPSCARVAEIEEDIEEIGSMFDNLTYSTQGLTANKCNIEAGGYCKIGKLVIANIRVRTTDAIPEFTSTVLVSGLPVQDTTFNAVSFSASLYTDASAYLDMGALTFRRATALNANNVITFSATYLAR